MSPLLYHYSCDHGARGIRADGGLRGNVHPLLTEVGRIIWLTDMDVPDRLALGLTSNLIRCDRTAHRFTVQTELARHWPSAARELCGPAARRELDMSYGARPMHWWVVVTEDVLPLGERGGA